MGVPQIMADQLTLDLKSTVRGRLCPPHYYWHPRIFKSSYGPVNTLVEVDVLMKIHVAFFQKLMMHLSYFQTYEPNYFPKLGILKIAYKSD